MSAVLRKKNERYDHFASILIPMLNEAGTILFVLNRLKKSLIKVDYEIIVVDDGSMDHSGKEVEKFISLNPNLNISYIYQSNLGKGGAIRTAIAKASGEILVVQDADLEYDPNDILPLLKLFKEDVHVVYGSRNMNKEDREHSSPFFYWGGLLVTMVTNLLFGSKLTDEATGYKLFSASLFDDLEFENNDFAWEPEITAKILKRHLRIIELPISYKPRSKSEGKKISWKDGVKAIWVLLKERFRK